MISELQPVSSSRWGTKLVSHLLNRAGFGFPHERVRSLAESDPDQAVSSLVDFATAEEGLPAPPADDMPPDISRQELNQEIKDLPRPDKIDRRQEWRREQRSAVRDVIRPWWIKRMLNTSNPLQEKLTLFWHGHFATSARKVRNAHYNLQLNQIFRTSAAGNVRELTRAVGKSPCMLRYLDNFRSKKQNPNENWAREVLELFTMGLGNYTEKDIKEGARAFTGWTIENGSFTFRSSWHDDGKKTILGETGTFDGDDVIDLIFEQPETSRFIVRQLWEFFVYPSPDEKIVRELAALLRLNNYELRPVLKQLFISKAFYSERARGTLVKSPVQFVVGLYGEMSHNRDDDQNIQRMDRLMKQLGQRLFWPPDVSGWDGNRGWIDTNKLLDRYNMIQTFVQRGNTDRYLRNKLKDLDGQQLQNVVGKLERALLPIALDDEQRRVLANALAGTSKLEKTFNLKKTSKKQLRTFGQLMLSTAEYQLC